MNCSVTCEECERLTVGGADESKAGDDPEEGHGYDEDAVLKVWAAVLSLNSAGSQPIRAACGLSAAYQSCGDAAVLTGPTPQPAALWLAQSFCYHVVSVWK